MNDETKFIAIVSQSDKALAKVPEQFLKYIIFLWYWQQNQLFIPDGLRKRLRCKMTSYAERQKPAGKQAVLPVLLSSGMLLTRTVFIYRHFYDTASRFFNHAENDKQGWDLHLHSRQAKTGGFLHLDKIRILLAEALSKTSCL